MQSTNTELRGLKARVLASYDKLSRKHRGVADFVLRSPAEVSVLSSASLADRLGVSNSTVIRFSQALGFSGYAELKQDLLSDLQQDLRPVEHFRLSENGALDDTLDGLVRQEVANINTTLSRLSRADFSTIAEAICAAERVYLVGESISSVLAYHLYYMLQQVQIDAVNPLADVIPFEERVLRMSPNDLVIGFSFPLYSRSTLERLRLARERGVPVVAVTDSETAPAALLARHVLVVATENSLFNNSATAFSVAAIALATEIARGRRTEIREELEEQGRRLGGTFLV